jgi:signal transduction histidine kinase
MNTYFDTPEKVDKDELATEIEIINENPVMTGLLFSIGGLLAVLDGHRQVVALNNFFLKTLGIDNAAEVLGLRLGEVVKCVHAHDEPAGCGTTKYCISCGAAIAILSSSKRREPLERICALKAYRFGTILDMAFLVRSSPIRIQGKKFLLLFLQDITAEQQRAALERTFFHDINNMLTGLVGAGELLAAQGYNPVIAEIIRSSSARILSEIEMQRMLYNVDQSSIKANKIPITPDKVIKELQAFYLHHPAAHNKKIDFSYNGQNITFKSDLSLLLRVLCNMITNALEATEQNGTIKVWFEQGQEAATFCVWNSATIEPQAALRIFQRNFSTKNEPGRGIGTFSMKLFGEKMLGGKVSFTSTAEQGTIFKIALPLYER